jgi:hypothetical protein
MLGFFQLAHPGLVGTAHEIAPRSIVNVRLEQAAPGGHNRVAMFRTALLKAALPRTILTLAAAVILVTTAGAALQFTPVANWNRLPPGKTQMGNMHGDVAVSSAGEVYVSVQDPEAGLQVYSPAGAFLRSLPGAPPDLHGFVIRKHADGEYIYGARMRGQEALKMTLDGRIVLSLPASAIPAQFKNTNAQTGLPNVLFTGIDVAASGDIYVTDGYASDYIHRFNRLGTYLGSFGGKQPPYSFNTLHKLAIDTRFEPARLIGTDRANNRVVHMALDGTFIGVVAKDLLLPAAIVISGDYAIVGELTGRATILDKSGAVVGRLGENKGDGVGSNKLPPEQWKTGLFLAPHGVALNARGDLFVSEFNAFGRVHRFNRNP